MHYYHRQNGKEFYVCVDCILYALECHLDWNSVVYRPNECITHSLSVIVNDKDSCEEKPQIIQITT